jgi:hypothetical protein
MYVSGIAGPEEAKNLSGKCPPPVSDPFSAVEFGKNHISLSRQKGCKRESPIQVTLPLLTRTKRRLAGGSDEAVLQEKSCLLLQNCGFRETAMKAQKEPLIIL